jgi:hypothetical protein
MSKTPTFHNLQSLDLQYIHYSDPKKMKTGAKLVFMSYGEDEDDRHKLVVKTPEVEFPFAKPKIYDGKLSCSVALKGEDTKMTKFIEGMQRIDAQVKSDATANSKAWFGKKASPELIDEKYHRCVKPYVDPETAEPSDKYAPLFNFKVDKDCKFYDSSKRPIEVSDESHEDYKDPCELLVKGATARIILRCNGLWFSNTSFGTIWRPGSADGGDEGGRGGRGSRPRLRGAGARGSREGGGTA